MNGNDFASALDRAISRSAGAPILPSPETPQLDASELKKPMAKVSPILGAQMHDL
jgi:hypothetical protein